MMKLRGHIEVLLWRADCWLHDRLPKRVHELIAWPVCDGGDWLLGARLRDLARYRWRVWFPRRWTQEELDAARERATGLRRQPGQDEPASEPAIEWSVTLPPPPRRNYRTVTGRVRKRPPLFPKERRLEMPMYMCALFDIDPWQKDEDASEDEEPA